MYSVLVAAMALHAGVHNLDNSSGIVDTLLPTGATVWTVSCDGTFAVQYLNDFDGDFIIMNNRDEESRVSGERSTVTTHRFVAQTRVIMIASVKSVSGNKKVLFSWACDAVPAALPSTLNTAGDVSHMNYGPDEQKSWVLQCKEDEDVNIKWTSFNIGNDSLWMGHRENGDWSTFFNASDLDTAEDFTFTSTGATHVFFRSEVDSAGGDFAFRYECLSNAIVLPSSGIVDRLLPSKIADTIWTVSCDGIFAVQYLNDFGGDFIISVDGIEESRVNGEHKRVLTQNFTTRTAVTMTASMKTGNKKVLFSWACDAVPAALPSTLNTAGDVSHMNYGPDEQNWILKCQEDEEVNITWTSFNIGNDALWMGHRKNRVWSTFFNASDLDNVEDFTFTSTGATYVFFRSEVDSAGGDFAFHYECLSNDIVLPSSGIVDRLLPNTMSDTVWTVSCDGIFTVQYLNDFGGDFIISVDGIEESRVSGDHNRLITKNFATRTAVTMTARVKWWSGNKKVLFSWACDAVPAALPSTLNTAGNVSHMKYGPNEHASWALKCKKDEDVRITWTSFNIGNDALWMGHIKNRVWSTFFNASDLDTVEDFTFTSTGATLVFFTSMVDSAGGDFAFRYECLSNDIVLPSSGIVDRLLPTKIADTVWTVSCDGIFAVQYLNDFGGDFIISNNGNEESRVSGEHKTLTTKSFAADTTVTMTASMKTGNKKVLFSWACDAVPAALPSTLNTAGDVSHMKYRLNEQELWILQCKEDEDVNITWTSFNIGNDSLRMMHRDNGVWSTFFNASALDTADLLSFTSIAPTYVFFRSEVDSAGGDFAFRYECLSNDIVLPSSGIVDRLLPSKIADNIWTVSCDGIFAVQYLNDFGGDFIISVDGIEESRVNGEHKRVLTQNFATRTTVTMTASMKTGNKKVLFSWACDAVPAALPSTLNTAGNVSHMKYGANEQELWILQCEAAMRITWTSFNIGNDSLWMVHRGSAFFNGSGLDTVGDFTFTSTGATYVFFRSEVDSDGGDFAFRYECLSTPAPPTAEPSAVPTAPPTTAPTASPTAPPTTAPTALPTASPTVPPARDTAEPTAEPTTLPEGHTLVPTTEAPSSAAMTWCTSDAQCKEHGDTAATCKDNGHCTCGDGFVKPFDAASGRRAHICVSSETRVSDVVYATFNVACDGSSGKGARVGELVVDLVGGTVTDVREECGSLNVFVSVSDMLLLDVAAMDVAARLSEKVQASDLGLGDVLSAGLASVDALQCPTVPGVSQVFRTDVGECVPLSCLSGYTRSSRHPFVCSANKATPLPTTPLQPQEEETPEPDTGADALAVGAIIGICLGGITALAIVVLAFVVCKVKQSPSKDVPNFRISNSAL